MNLQNLNLAELTTQESRQIDGGTIPTNWLAALAAAAWSAWDNASDFPDGYAAGHAAYHP